MKLSVFTCLLAMLPFQGAWGANFITVNPVEGDATAAVQRVIDSVAGFNGKPVTVKFAPGNTVTATP